jgi:hypothetical protein
VDGNILAEALRDRIRASGLSISRLAVESKTVHPVVHRFASGEGDITLRTASKLAGILGLDFVPRSQGQLFEAIFARAVEMFDELDRELRKDGVTLQAARVRRYRDTVLRPELTRLRQQIGSDEEGPKPPPAADAEDTPKDAKDTEDAAAGKETPKEKDRKVGKPVNRLPRKVVKPRPADQQ